MDDQPTHREGLYRRRGMTNLIIHLFEAEMVSRTVQTKRDQGKITRVEPHPLLVECIDFAPVYDAFHALTPGQRIVYLAIACAVARVRPMRWEQRTHPKNGKPHRYSEEEVASHYRMGFLTVHAAWMEADNRMTRAFREVERQIEPREE